MNYQSKVLEFQQKGGEDFSKGLTPLRESLLKEEIAELEQAVKDNNRVEILDALCDIKYVNDGNANIDNCQQWDDAYFRGYGSHLFDSNEIAMDSYLDQFKEDNLTYIDDINDAVIMLSYLFGFTLENFKTALDRVHESNMSKFPKTEQEAIDSVQAYKDKGIDTLYTDTFVIKRTSDGKILKSKYYHAVELSDLV